MIRPKNAKVSGAVMQVMMNPKAEIKPVVARGTPAAAHGWAQVRGVLFCCVLDMSVQGRYGGTANVTTDIFDFGTNVEQNTGNAPLIRLDRLSEHDNGPWLRCRL